MENTITKFKNYLQIKTSNTENYEREPQIGFKVTYSITSRELTVRVIGARQLPTSYGNNKPSGYLIKVTLFPHKEKFETKIAEESWPVFEEEFVFHSVYLTSSSSFLSFTVYALLSNNESVSNKSKNVLRRFFSVDNGEVPARNRNRPSFRYSLNSRRTVGGVTYHLNTKKFIIRYGNNIDGTPDIWQKINDISSGIPSINKEDAKGNVEVTILYNQNSSGNNDILDVAVTKFRCCLQTMQEHEKIGGSLYIKVYAFEFEDVIQKIRSDRFDPTISLKLEKKTSVLKVKVDSYSIQQLRIIIKLMCKPLLGQKIELGRIEIDKNSPIWQEIIEKPNVVIMKAINLE